MDWGCEFNVRMWGFISQKLGVAYANQGTLFQMHSFYFSGTLLRTIKRHSKLHLLAVADATFRYGDETFVYGYYPNTRWVEPYLVNYDQRDVGVSAGAKISLQILKALTLSLDARYSRFLLRFGGFPQDGIYPDSIKNMIGLQLKLGFKF